VAISEPDLHGQTVGYPAAMLTSGLERLRIIVVAERASSSASSEQRWNSVAFLSTHTDDGTTDVCMVADVDDIDECCQIKQITLRSSIPSLFLSLSFSVSVDSLIYGHARLSDWLHLSMTRARPRVIVSRRGFFLVRVCRSTSPSVGAYASYLRH